MERKNPFFHGWFLRVINYDKEEKFHSKSSSFMCSTTNSTSCFPFHSSKFLASHPSLSHTPSITIIIGSYMSDYSCAKPSQDICNNAISEAFNLFLAPFSACTTCSFVSFFYGSLFSLFSLFSFVSHKFYERLLQLVGINVKNTTRPTSVKSCGFRPYTQHYVCLCFSDTEGRIHHESFFPPASSVDVKLIKKLKKRREIKREKAKSDEKLSFLLRMFKNNLFGSFFPIIKLLSFFSKEKCNAKDEAYFVHSEEEALCNAYYDFLHCNTIDDCNYGNFDCKITAENKENMLFDSNTQAKAAGNNEDEEHLTTEEVGGRSKEKITNKETEKDYLNEGKNKENNIKQDNENKIDVAQQDEAKDYIIEETDDLDKCVIQQWKCRGVGYLYLHKDGKAKFDITSPVKKIHFKGVCEGGIPWNPKKNKEVEEKNEAKLYENQNKKSLIYLNERCLKENKNLQEEEIKNSDKENEETHSESKQKYKLNEKQKEKSFKEVLIKQKSFFYNILSVMYNLYTFFKRFFFPPTIFPRNHNKEELSFTIKTDFSSYHKFAESDIFNYIKVYDEKLLDKTNVSTEGWLGSYFKNFLPCRYNVLFMGGLTNFTVEIKNLNKNLDDCNSNKSIFFKGFGVTHAENNWSKHFAYGWNWLQVASPFLSFSDFPQEELQKNKTSIRLIFAGGLMFSHFKKIFVLGFRSKSISWDFSSAYLDSFSFNSSYSKREITILAKSHFNILKYLLGMEQWIRVLHIYSFSPKENFTYPPLHIPTYYGMSNAIGCEESHSALTFINAYIQNTITKQCIYLESHVLPNSALEFGGSFRK